MVCRCVSVPARDTVPTSAILSPLRRRTHPYDGSSSDPLFFVKKRALFEIFVVPLPENPSDAGFVQDTAKNRKSRGNKMLNSKRVL